MSQFDQSAQFDVYVCIDCGFFLANGEPDEAAEGWNSDQVHADWKGYHLVNGDSDKDMEFSSSPCECCRTPLAGTRMHCVAWKCD